MITNINNTLYKSCDNNINIESDEKTMDKIVDKINTNKFIPRCLIKSDLYKVYNLNKYKILELSHVDIYRAKINVVCFIYVSIYFIYNMDRFAYIFCYI